MPQQLSINVLERRRNAKIKDLAKVGPMIQGSLATIEVTCGNPNCRCAQGDKHTSHIITKKVRGKTKSVYVPVDRREEVKAWTREYRRIKQLIKEISEINEKILKVHVTSKRARKANQDAASKHKEGSR